MKFDIVIGNPPYNSDQYVDFAALSYKLSSSQIVMVTPGKWQGKDSKKSWVFRKGIVPHMSHLVFYPDCLDLFGISDVSGITYYVLDKNFHTTCHIKNINNYQPLINSETTRDIRNRETLWNIGTSIVAKLKGNKYVINQIAEKDRLNYTIAIAKTWCGSRVSSGAWDFETSSIKPKYIGKGGVIFNPSGDIKVLGRIEGLLANEPSTINNRVYLFTSNNKSEVLSFYSWLTSKFISFLILINLNSSSIINNNTLRFIPDPGPFNHLFTDEELYRTNNLNSDEAHIIDSLIKPNITKIFQN